MAEVELLDSNQNSNIDAKLTTKCLRVEEWIGSGQFHGIGERASEFVLSEVWLRIIGSGRVVCVLWAPVRFCGDH